MSDEMFTCFTEKQFGTNLSMVEKGQGTRKPFQGGGKPRPYYTTNEPRKPRRV